MKNGKEQYFHEFIQHFGHLICEVPTDDVKYQMSEMLNKFMQIRLFAIFQILMASESGFLIKKGLANGCLEK